MPVTVETLSAAEQAAMAAGKPIALGLNALRAYRQLPTWASARNWASAGDRDLALYPARWVHDDRLLFRSRPDRAAATEQFLLFDLSEGVDIDAIVIANHNLSALTSGTITVRVGVADDSAFATNRRVIAEWTAFGTERLVAVDLTDDGAHGAGEFRRFSGVRYAYLEITTSTSWSAEEPQIGEVFLGRRRQLARLHNYPGDDTAEVSRADDWESDGGHLVRYVRHRGRRDLSLRYTPDARDALGLDDIAVWRALYDDLEDGTRPFFYLRDPAAPGDAPLMKSKVPGQRFDHQGPNHANIDADILELPPFVSGEVPAALVAGPPYLNTRSYRFDGVDEYIEVTDHPDLDLTAELTFACWVNLDTVAENLAIATKWVFSSDGGWALQTSFSAATPGALTLFLATGPTDPGTGCRIDTTTQPLTSGSWHHVAFTFNAGVVTIYVDGAVVAHTVSGAIPAALLANGAALRIGAWSGALSRYFGPGNLDEVLLYDRALGGAEVAALAASPAPDVTGLASWSDAVLYLDADNSSNPTATDVRAGGGGATVSHDGTMTNMEAGDVAAAVP